MFRCPSSSHGMVADDKMNFEESFFSCFCPNLASTGACFAIKDFQRNININIDININTNIDIIINTNVNININTFNNINIDIDININININIKINIIVTNLIPPTLFQ